MSSNWLVISQNIKPGEMVSADSDVKLIAQKYTSIDKEGRADIPPYPDDGAAESSESDTEKVPEENMDKETDADEVETNIQNSSENTTAEVEEEDTEKTSTEKSMTETETSETEAKQDEAQVETETEPASEETEEELNIDFESAETIKRLQEALNEAGYDCGVADGIAGKKTKGAISRFRADQGLPEGDTIDAELIKSVEDYFENLPDTSETEIIKTETPPASKPSQGTITKNHVNKNLVVVMCEKDKDYTTMYDIVFADTDSNGNYTNFYAFDTYNECVNPRDMGEEFNAIGPLPSWFHVGATVHVDAKLTSKGGLEVNGCKVTPAS